MRLLVRMMGLVEDADWSQPTESELSVLDMAYVRGSNQGNCKARTSRGTRMITPMSDFTRPLLRSETSDVRATTGTVNMEIAMKHR